MNFAPFTGHIPSAAAIPSIHQFAAKFGYEGGGAALAGAAGERYAAGAVQFAVAPAAAVVDAKFRPADGGVVVVSAAPPAAVALAGIAPIHTVNTGVKYQTISSSSVSLGYGGAQYAAELKGDKREYREDLHHDIMATMMHQQVSQSAPLSMGTQQLVVVLAEPKDALRPVKQEMRADRVIGPNDYITVNLASLGDMSDASWQLGSVTGVTGVTGVADYLSALPLPLHHLLKYSADKRDDQPTVLAVNTLPAGAVPVTTMVTEDNSTVVVAEGSPAPSPPPAPAANTKKNKKKKKNGKEKKPRPVPGEIRLTTALDGSTLYCCPECHMAYPERGLLQQHLLGHTMERRFICDICNAALKRKDHLTRHKQSHNPERPHTCSVCLKAFKRKEQLTLHFVIHSGEKRHVCTECGKGFYRKDHLRKHTRSHIARRVKAEMSAGGVAGEAGAGGGPPLPAAVPAPQPEPS